MFLKRREPERPLRGNYLVFIARLNQHHSLSCIQQLSLNVIMRRIDISPLAAFGKRRPFDCLIVSWLFIYIVWHFRLKPCMYDYPSGHPDWLNAAITANCSKNQTIKTDLPSPAKRHDYGFTLYRI